MITLISSDDNPLHKLVLKILNQVLSILTCAGLISKGWSMGLLIIEPKVDFLAL